MSIFIFILDLLKFRKSNIINAMTISEKELIRQLKHGEDKAYRYLYDVYYEMLCRVAYEYLKDDFLAETIVGDTIFNFYEKRLTIEIQSSLRAYFVRAVRNRCISYLRLSHVSKETKLQPSDDLLESEAILAIAENHPLDTLLEKELKSQISMSIEQLPDKCRTVFKMNRLENLNYREISEKLDISVNTVKYHMKNALSRLHSDLKKYLITWLLLFLSNIL